MCNLNSGCNIEGDDPDTFPGNNLELLETFLETVTERYLSPTNKARFMSLAATYLPATMAEAFPRCNIFGTSAGKLALPMSPVPYSVDCRIIQYVYLTFASEL
jgi:hypothetical protein